MRIDPEVVPQVASQVLLQLVLDGAVKAAPTHLASVEADLAIALRTALRGKDYLDRCRRDSRQATARGHKAAARRYATILQTTSGRRGGMVSVAEAILTRLRWNRGVEIHCDDDMLLRKIRWTFARIAKHAKKGSAKGSARFGTLAPLAPGGGPAGGSPAEARVSDAPPPPQPAGEDPDRHDR